MPRPVIPFFPQKEQICIPKTLVSYLETTKKIRHLPYTDRVILTTRKPIHNASAVTISQWTKFVMVERGVDLITFSASNRYSPNVNFSSAY